MIALVTATICPNVGMKNIKIGNYLTRENQYKKTLDWLITIQSISGIVFCDNSNYDLSAWEKKYKNARIPMEFLRCPVDMVKCVRYGKGYGEGEMIKYAIENSSLLHNDDDFFKITGRLTVSNIEEILKKIHKNKCYMKLLSAKTKDVVDTRFYITNLEIYRKYFMNLYLKVNEEAGVTIEKIFYLEIKNKNVKVENFPWFPAICGFSGSTGVKYDENKYKIYIKHFLQAVGCYKIT